MSSTETLEQRELVLEGTWEEIAQHAEIFAGKRLRVLLLPTTPEPHAGKAAPFHETASPTEWAEAFFAWGHGHPRREAPPLSDAAISRESIYGDRLDRQR
jgi:hypothetical protein